MSAAESCVATAPAQAAALAAAALDAQMAVRFFETLGALVAFGVVLILVSRAFARRPSPDGPEAAAAVVKTPLWVRFGTLIGLALAVFGPAYAGTFAWAGFVVVLVALGLGEFWGMLERAGTHPHKLTGWLAGLALPLVALWGDGPAWLGVAFTAGVLALSAVALFSRAEAPLPGRLGGTLLGVAYVGLLGAHLVLIQLAGGFGALAFFLMVVQLADVGGLMGGVLLGRHKMVPRLSPGKTWEGTATGFVAAGLAAWLFAFTLPAVPLVALVAIALALAAAGLVGDLLASGLKRAAGLKDFGWVLPGHGGVLDRFDGYLYAAPVFWAALKLSALPACCP